MPCRQPADETSGIWTTSIVRKNLGTHSRKDSHSCLHAVSMLSNSNMENTMQISTRLETRATIASQHLLWTR